MADHVLQTLQQLIHDVIAPDLHELKVRFTALEKQMDVRFEGVDKRFTAWDQKSDAQFQALLAAISESKAQAELTSTRVIATLSERVAVLEAQRHQSHKKPRTEVRGFGFATAMGCYSLMA